MLNSDDDLENEKVSHIIQRKEYKKPLSIDEQIEYLKANKRVVFNQVDEKTAALILYEFNYINVITPYKHYFTLKDAKGVCIRDKNGKHVYTHDTDFIEYYQLYMKERSKYPTIYKNIMKFETAFNAIVSYELITYYQIDSYERFIHFMDLIIYNVQKEKLLFTKENEDQYTNNKEIVLNKIKRCDYAIQSLTSMKQSINKYDDIYIFMDRLSISSIINIYMYCDKKNQNRIFDKLLETNNALIYTSNEPFKNFLKRIVPIRNCVFHFNSLEILINYYKIKSHELRKSSDKKQYLTIINELSNCHEKSR